MLASSAQPRPTDNVPAHSPVTLTSITVEPLGLLLDALRRSLAHADQITAMAVVVDAKDEAAAAFYRHYGFLSLQAQPSKLFVAMRLVAQLLGRRQWTSSTTSTACWAIGARHSSCPAPD